MVDISGKTGVYGIFGDPVGHSLSPVMQNTAIQKAGYDAIYVPFHVRSHELEGAVSGLRAMAICGVNVTVPHKQNVMPYLDQIDDQARQIGAVNTIVNREGVLVGYNTDGIGFLRALHEDLRFQPRGQKVVLFGAGGACRAGLVALLHEGAAEVVLVNRTLEKAQAMADDLGRLLTPGKIRAVPAAGSEFERALFNADLVVNTTSIGLQNEMFDMCPLEKIKASASVYDMVYSTAETPFVRAARARGFRAVDGLGMLAGQGEEAFSLWFHAQPEHGLMKNCLLQMRTSNQS